MIEYPSEYFFLDEDSKLRSPVEPRDTPSRSIEGVFLCADKRNIFTFGGNEIRVLDPFALGVKLRFPFQGKGTPNFDFFPRNTKCTHLSYESGPALDVPETKAFTPPGRLLIEVFMVSNDLNVLIFDVSTGEVLLRDEDIEIGPGGQISRELGGDEEYKFLISRDEVLLKVFMDEGRFLFVKNFREDIENVLANAPDGPLFVLPGEKESYATLSDIWGCSYVKAFDWEKKKFEDYFETSEACEAGKYWILPERVIYQDRINWEIQPPCCIDSVEIFSTEYEEEDQEPHKFRDSEGIISSTFCPPKWFAGMRREELPESKNWCVSLVIWDINTPREIFHIQVLQDLGESNMSYSVVPLDNDLVGIKGQGTQIFNIPRRKVIETVPFRVEKLVHLTSSKEWQTQIRKALVTVAEKLPEDLLGVIVKFF